MFNIEDIKDEATEKAKEATDRLETKWNDKPIYRYMTYAFGVIVLVLMLYALSSCVAQADPRQN
jgi:hypothetical protein